MKFNIFPVFLFCCKIASNKQQNGPQRATKWCPTSWKRVTNGVSVFLLSGY